MIDATQVGSSITRSRRKKHGMHHYALHLHLHALFEFSQQINQTPSVIKQLSFYASTRSCSTLQASALAANRALVICQVSLKKEEKR
jgi:hypothetical protein